MPQLGGLRWGFASWGIRPFLSAGNWLQNFVGYDIQIKQTSFGIDPKNNCSMREMTWFSCGIRDSYIPLGAPASGTYGYFLDILDILKILKDATLTRYKDIYLSNNAFKIFIFRLFFLPYPMWWLNISSVIFWMVRI